MGSQSPHIGLSMGDPSGVGPEIVVAALRARPDLAERVTVFGDAHVRAHLPSATRLEAVSALPDAERRPGQPSLAGARAQVAYLDAAVSAAKAGDIDALVTAPISKEQARRAGFVHPGHTEYLAHAFAAPEVAMMFVGPRLRVVLATTHIPLAAVAEELSVEHIHRAARLAVAELVTRLDVPAPRVGVLGLNPHAGEHGLFGDEEARIVEPAIARVRATLAAQGLTATVSGPLVPDAAFRQATSGVYDVLVALYHDQALIPVKLVDFDEAVNVTLGLPIVRTSVDHGVAYDIAGTNRARPDSLIAALALADRLTRR